MTESIKENLESKVNGTQIYQVGGIGTALLVLGSFISRYGLQSEEVAQCFDRGMLFGVGFTIGGYWINYIEKCGE